jgi:hypothetical protein
MLPEWIEFPYWSIPVQLKHVWERNLFRKRNCFFRSILFFCVEKTWKSSQRWVLLKPSRFREIKPSDIKKLRPNPKPKKKIARATAWPFFPVRMHERCEFSIFCIFVDPQNFDVKFCGSTIFRFPGLWIHKIFKKLSTHFVETQVRDSKFCGSTIFWMQHCGSTKWRWGLFEVFLGLMTNFSSVTRGIVGINLI